jgi:ferredoxin
LANLFEKPLEKRQAKRTPGNDGQHSKIMSLLPVRFEPNGTTVMVSPGTTLLEAARRAGIEFSPVCCGQGECGECWVLVLEGQVSSVTQQEMPDFPAPEWQPARHLACCTRVLSPARICIIK